MFNVVFKIQMKMKQRKKLNCNALCAIRLHCNIFVYWTTNDDTVRHTPKMHTTSCQQPNSSQYSALVCSPTYRQRLCFIIGGQVCDGKISVVSQRLSNKMAKTRIAEVTVQTGRQTRARKQTERPHFIMDDDEEECVPVNKRK